MTMTDPLTSALRHGGVGRLSVDAVGASTWHYQPRDIKGWPWPKVAVYAMEQGGVGG